VPLDPGERPFSVQLLGATSVDPHRIRRVSGHEHSDSSGGEQHED